MTLQCPSRTLSPCWGKRVGGVSERAGAKAGRSHPSAIQHSFACRDGERHPGLLEGGSLRGASSERGPRSVRQPGAVSPASVGRADDSGCPMGRRGGERRRHTPISVCTHRTHERSSHALGRTRPSLGPRPVPVDPHYAPGGAIRSVVRRSRRHHGWANPRKWEEPTLGLHERTERGSPRVTASARERACHVRQGKEVEASVSARTRELGFGCPHVESLRCRSR